MGHNNGNASQNWIKLNVGGKVFLTTKQTLTKEPESFLSRLVLEDPDLPTDKVRFCSPSRLLILINEIS